MTRWTAPLTVVLIITLATIGCAPKKADDSSLAMAPAQDVYYNEPAYEINEPAYNSEPMPAARPTMLTGTQPVENTYQPEPVQAAASRYHVVGKKETLYSLARMYYGDHRRWKEIYQANSSIISDPNKIFVGQKLLIP